MAGLLLPAATLPAEAALPFEEVAEGIFVRFGLHEEVTAANCGAIANTGFIVGEDSVAVIDSGTTHRQGLALREAVAAATDKPISHLFATHVHFDHCFGHSAFADLPLRSIGHRNLPRALAERGPFYSELLTETCPDFAGTVVVPPNETVTDRLQVDLGHRPLQVRAWRTAHTNTDLTVFDEKTGTLWTGDLVFAERLPTLDGSINGWLQVLDELLDDGVVRIVPGHGPVSDGRAALAAERAYLETLRDGVRAAIAEGLDIPATLERLGSDNGQNWQVFEHNHGRNIVSAYTELEWE
ncbi:MAG: quinoprotein relay system zinc metallohydrolase 2 [Kiloniellaceae bacterium]